MQGINGAEFKIKRTGKRNQNTFTIGDTSGFSPYVRGGIVVEVKQPKTLAFKSLRVSRDAPGPRAAFGCGTASIRSKLVLLHRSRSLRRARS